SRSVSFSSDYPHTEGGRNPISRFEITLGDRSETIRNEFFFENFPRIFPRVLTKDGAVELRPLLRVPPSPSEEEKSVRSRSSIGTRAWRVPTSSVRIGPWEHLRPSVWLPADHTS